MKAGAAACTGCGEILPRGKSRSRAASGHWVSCGRGEGSRSGRLLLSLESSQLLIPEPDCDHPAARTLNSSRGSPEWFDEVVGCCCCSLRFPYSFGLAESRRRRHPETRLQPLATIGGCERWGLASLQHVGPTLWNAPRSPARGLPAFLLDAGRPAGWPQPRDA
jgi:hypothetical protein